MDVDYSCDLSTPTGPDELIDAVARDRGPITALILSQAHDEPTGILDTTSESFDLHVAVNPRASLLLIAAFARQIPSGGDAIVALTSDHTTGNLPYGASKGALDRIVISAAPELGPRGISANALNPGPIDTEVAGRDIPAVRLQARGDSCGEAAATSSTGHQSERHSRTISAPLDMGADGHTTSSQRDPSGERPSRTLKGCVIAHNDAPARRHHRRARGPGPRHVLRPICGEVGACEDAKSATVRSGRH